MLLKQGHKILIFGKKGQLGTSFKIGFNSHKNFLQLGKDDVDFLNLKSIPPIINEFKPTLIFNVSAYTNVNLAENNIDDAYKINGNALTVIAKTALKNKSTLIHFSTDYIFDGFKLGKYRETDLPNPLNIYGKSKLFGEKNILKSECNFFIFRISWLMSEFGTNFLKTIMNKIYEGEDLFVINDQIGSPISSELVTQIVVEILAKDKIKNPKEIFHLSTKGKISWFDIAIHTAKIMSASKNVNIKSISSNYYDSKVKRPQNSIFDHTKVEQILGRKLPFWKDDITPVIKKILLKTNN